MSKVTIELSSPITGPRGSIKAITLREPTYRDFIDLGFPVTWVSTEGGGFQQETSSLIGQWIERLSDVDPNLLALLGLRDALKLRDAIHDFFQQARTEEESSKSSAVADGSSSATPSMRGPSVI